MNILLISAAAAIALIALAQLMVSNQFAAIIETLRTAAAAEQVAGPVDNHDLPDIMRRFAIRNGATFGAPMAVMARQNAEMRLAPGQSFFPITATQLSGTRQPSFVWDAWGTMAGLVPVHVVDAYVGGSGLLEVRLAGSIRVARATGPESDKGEMMRFLSELPWNPDAILGATGLNWRQIDLRTVEVSAPTSGGIAIVRLLFGVFGDIEGTVADDRPYAVDGHTVPTRWIGRFSDYGQFGSYRLPRRGEVSWQLPAGKFTYWRGELTAFSTIP